MTEVLIVEDEVELAAVTAEYLEASGLSVVHRDTAEAALNVLAHGPVGVILLDVNLPGMNGFHFTRQVRARADTPIIFISARASDDDQILALTVGGDDYVPIISAFTVGFIIMVTVLVNSVSPCPRLSFSRASARANRGST